MVRFTVVHFLMKTVNNKVLYDGKTVDKKIIGGSYSNIGNK